MADLTIQWSVENERQLSRRLQNVRVETSDFSAAFKRSTEQIRDRAAGPVFETQGAVIGEPWPPLSAFTVADKAAKGYGGQPPLVRTGTMQGSFRANHDKLGGVVWNDASYFKYHQSRRPRTRLPRRVMMKLDEFNRQVVVKSLQDHLRKAMRRR